ncbi:hypothetical protein HY772_07540, partial [Candidatus Woesearchaeota archaeon]|nr:hypothetical protein [Candidatus Woesearchaeota archaeon]
MTKTRYKQLLKTIRRASPQARLGVALAVIREIVASFLGLMADAREQVRKFNEQAQDWTGQEGQYFD